MKSSQCSIYMYLQMVKASVFHPIDPATVYTSVLFGKNEAFHIYH
jgi:hypothetical protein